jgi:hypothetical protein
MTRRSRGCREVPLVQGYDVSGTVSPGALSISLRFDPATDAWVLHDLVWLEPTFLLTPDP